MTSPAATLKAIAEQAGVSTSVVSAVLSGHHGSIRFSPQTAERVRTAARKAHYRPHRMARNLHAKDHQAIGLLVSSFFLLPTFYLHWLSLALGQRNRLLIIQNLQDLNDPDACPMLQQRFVDAAVCAEVPGKALLQRCSDIGLPVLFINADPGNSVPRLLFDEKKCITDITTHLHERGYRQFILQFHLGAGYWVNERKNACLTAAKRLGLPRPILVTAHDSELAVTADRIAAACSSGSGVIVENAQLLPFLLQRLNDRGLQVPRDVGIVSLAKAAPADMTWTCVNVDTKILAATSTDLLLTPGALTRTTCHRAAYDVLPARSTDRHGHA